MSTITTEARQITLDSDLAEEQIPALRAETGAICWLVTAEKIMVEASSDSETVDFSNIFSALVRRGITATDSLTVSRMSIAA